MAGDLEGDHLQGLLIFLLVLVGFGLLGPVPCWVSFRSVKEEQLDLKTRYDGFSDWLGIRFRHDIAVLMQLLPM